MPNDVARNFAKCNRGLVVAPAGFGKTHLIAESLGYVSGKELILTHTHAGVDALRTKLTSFGVSSSKYRVTTIDSLALCYAKAFPHLAGWKGSYPSGNEEWYELRVASSRLFRCRAPRRVLRASYDGIFVDEYQDCCGTQHEMIKSIAEALPCRVVGDPLQAIYRALHGNDVMKWSVVKSMFPIVDVLNVPYRWQEKNPKLGEWLGDVRSRLEKGSEVEFANAYGTVNWTPSADMQQRIAACYGMFDKVGVVAICDWPARCAEIAGKTRNHFSVLESVECHDLLRFAEDMENSQGLKRVLCVIDFAERCFTGMSLLADLHKRLKIGKAYRPRSPDKVCLWNTMKTVKESVDLGAVENMMSAIERLSTKHFYKRRELWCEMKRTLQGYDSGSERSLREVAWVRRDAARRNGRNIFSRWTIATPLLIKGLEFDHAILLDTIQMKSAEELYVALTRGSTSLTILCSERSVRHSPPAWVREGND